MVDDTYLHSLPLSSLPYKTRKLLSCLLNSPKIIPSDGPDKLPRDWRGLACRANISSEVESYIQQCSDKTAKVLEIWQQHNRAASVGELLSHLQYIDRYDVHDDVRNDLRVAIENGELSGSRQNQIAVQYHHINGVHTEGDSNQITYDDRPGYAHIYDAIVLYADEDKEFVDDMLTRMSDEGYQMCTVADLQAGHATQYAPVAQLIAERCLRIVLVFSPQFLRSSGMSFYMDYAQAVSIESKQRKIIPIMYRPCQLPRHLSYYHKLFYQSDGRSMYDFWYKLKQSLEVARMTNAQYLQHRVTNGSSIQSSPPQIIVDELPSSTLPEYEEGLFLPNRSDRSISMTALDTLTISSIAITDDCKSLSNISQVSGASVTKKKKKNPLRKLFSSFSKVKKKEAIMVAD